MSQDEQRPPAVDVESAREQVAAYRAGIPALQAREAQFQAMLTPEQQAAYLRLQIHLTTHWDMEKEAMLAVVRALVEQKGAPLDYACYVVQDIVDEGDVEFLRDPDWKPPYSA
jgi:hypothetical protein